MKKAKREKRILHGDITGVCYNCLNGGHEICHDKTCTCRKVKHKSWWWKTEDEIKKETMMLNNPVKEKV